ncbi:MAG: hypothetical protein M1828_006278 [Chrysothrix sp. TS-e1954]|nr:MAG: hypothetical protein M1828_006278 [Chrysothrix sp. TS-e1954]
MYSSFSLPFTLYQGGSAPAARHINIPSVAIHKVESSVDKRGRTLEHLLKANHTNHSIIYHALQFHNHTPHILGSAYLLGANTNQLTQVYESESKILEPWHDSPSEISYDVWRDFLGNRRYQRAYVDFFEDQLVAFGYDWRKLLDHFLFEGDSPLINSLISGGTWSPTDPSRLCVRALIFDLHKYLDNPAYTRPASYKADMPLEILERLSKDNRLDSLFSHKAAGDTELIANVREDALMDHWNAWDVSESPTKKFEKAQETAVALLVATSASSRFDFFLLHLLTTSHAVRILLPLMPADFQIPLVRQWWLFTLITYIGQLRPNIDPEAIKNFPLDERTWKHVDQSALVSRHAQDAHYVKGMQKR